MRTATTSALPRHEQRLLLRAALLRGPASLAAWRAWSAATTVDALEQDSQWLLPVLYLALRTQGVARHLLARYRNVYLHNWYKNHLALRRAEACAGRLGIAAGDLVLVGGAAMAIAYYQDPGARPFEGVQALRRPPQSSIGPAAGAGEPAASIPPAGSDIEVVTALYAAGDAALVGGTLDREWRTMRWRVLDPAGQVVDICARRDGWDRRSSLFWLADLATVLRRHPGLDWTRVAALAASLGHEGSVAASLATLDEVLEGDRGVERTSAAERVGATAS